MKNFGDREEVVEGNRPDPNKRQLENLWQQPETIDNSLSFGCVSAVPVLELPRL